MSRQAMEWALETRVGDPTRSLILVAIGKGANRDGEGSWASPETLGQYAECSERTVQRHIAVLIEGGLIREGDQSIIPDYIPKRRRPIVYDLAMDPETVALWATSERNGRRVAAEAAGAAAGRKGAPRRAEKRAEAKAASAAWGDSHDTPHERAWGDAHDTPRGTGDSHDTPPADGGGASWGDKWGDKWGVAGDTQTREEQEKNQVQDPGATADAADAGDGVLFGEAPVKPPRASRQARPPKDPDPVVLHAQSLCRPWWDALPLKPAGKRAFPNAVDLVVGDIKVGRSDAEISAALTGCGVAVARGALNYQYEQQARTRNGSSRNGNGKPPVAHGYGEHWADPDAAFMPKAKGTT